jgi:ankyrin repeat protein
MKIQSNQSPLQQALLKAAKAGNIALMRELIDAGANPYANDELQRSALSYLMEQNFDALKDLLIELDRKTLTISGKGDIRYE